MQTGDVVKKAVAWDDETKEPTLWSENFFKIVKLEEYSVDLEDFPSARNSYKNVPITDIKVQ